MKWYKIWDVYNKNISNKIARFFTSDKATEQIIEYGINITINGLEKMFLLIIGFYLIGALRQFAIAVLIMIPLRIWMGGTHRKTLLGCTIQSYLIFRVIIYLYRLIEAHRINPILIMIFILVVCLTFCPIIEERRGKYSIDKIIKFKKYACITIICLNLWATIWGKEYTYLLLACEIMQILDIFIAKITKERNMKSNEGKRIN